MSLNNLSTVEIDGQRYSKKFIQDVQAAEDAKNARAMKPVQDSLRQIHAEYRRMWAAPIDILQKASSGWVESATPNLGLPTISEETYDSYTGDPQRATEDARAMLRDIATLIAELPPRTGYVLGQNGAKRFRMFVLAQTKFQSAAVNLEMMLTCFRYLLDGNCFPESEYGYDEDLRVTEPQSESTPQSMDAVLSTMDINSREGDAALRKATEREWRYSHFPLVGEFWAFLKSTYLINPPDSDINYLLAPGGLFERRGWAITVDNLNAARRHMANSGRWVDAEGNPAITVQEVLDAKLNKNEIDYPTFVRECTRFDRMGKLNGPVREAKGFFLN